MGITALNLDIVSESSMHTVTPMAPDTCTTPGVAAGAPGPIPYPLVATSTTLKKGTRKTKVGGKKTLNAKGKVKSCTGNQAGTMKDITSFVTGGTSWPFPVPAVTVHFEGAPIAVTGTPGMGNDM